VARWVGWLDAEAKEHAFQKADIVVLPSTSEGLPIALLEALAYGSAVIATSVGSIPEVVRNGREALLVPPRDAGALADAILELAADPQRRRTLGERARERAGGFSPDRLIGELDSIYAAALSGELRNGH
jgi:glycosyltransferase involved in cell wall biosynthesis